MNKYVLVSLDDKKAKDIGSVLSNATAKEILSYLGEKEKVTPSEIAKALSLPLSTVMYNLQHLEKEDLVEKKDFAWSDKGKKVHFYAVAKKMIIIVPKGFNWQETLKKILPVALVGAVVSGALKWYPRTVPIEETSLAKMSLAMDTTRTVADAAPQYWLFALLMTGIIIITIITIDLWRRKK